MTTSVPVLAGAVIATACATSPNTDIDVEVAARQKDAVHRVCFTSQINNWRSLDGHAILVEKGVNDWYKLDLSGPCEPDLAFQRIALHSKPPGGCLSKGDAVATFTTQTYGVCRISGMYRWDAAVPVDTSRAN